MIISTYVKYPVTFDLLNEYPDVSSEKSLILLEKHGYWNITIKPTTLITNIPYSFDLCNKAVTFSILNSYRSQYPSEYDFYPTTYVFPSDPITPEIFNGEYYIYKVGCGSYGEYVHIFKTYKEYNTHAYSHINKNKQYCKAVIQKYISNPHLINDRKYDLRMYVFIKQLQPLESYIFYDGLIRIATEEYLPPNELNKICTKMHLTNTAINIGAKDILRQFSRDTFTPEQKRTMFNGCKYIATKTIKALYPTIISNIHSKSSTYKQNQDINQFSHLYGFDILFTSDLKAQLLEINQYPDMHASQPFEYKMKRTIIKDIIDILLYDCPDFSDRWDKLDIPEY